jgi:hypothetical protein
VAVREISLVLQLSLTICDHAWSGAGVPNTVEKKQELGATPEVSLRV